MTHRFRIGDSRQAEVRIAGRVRLVGAADRRRSIGMACASVLLLCATAYAEDQAGDDLIQDPPPQAQDAGVIDEQTFDQWLYGGDANATRRRLESRLRSKVDAAAVAGKLSDEQKVKLELAGRGDLRRLEERIEALRARLKGIRHDNNAVQALFQELHPLRLTINGDLFGRGSLYAKTLRRVLTAEQSAEYERLDRERRRFRYQAQIESVVTMLDGGLGFRDEQRRALVTLLLDETPVPRQFGQYDPYVILFQIQQLPIGKLEKILDPDQRRFLQRVLDRFQGIDRFLQQNGLLPDPADEPAASAALPGSDDTRKE